MSLETRETKLFGDILGFCWDIPGVPEKFETKSLCSFFEPLFRGPIWLDDRGTGHWKRMEEVPRCTSLIPLAFPCFVLCLIGVEKGF